MGVIAVLYLTENLLAGQFDYYVNLLLLILCLSEIARPRGGALIKGLL